MLNQTQKIISIFLLTASLAIAPGVVKADPPEQLNIYIGSDFITLEAQEHLKNMIRKFNDEMAMHNLIISSIVLSTIKTGGPNGENKHRARARSATSDTYAGRICVPMEDAYAGIGSKSKSKMEDDSDPTDVEVCFVWFPNN